MVFSCYKYSNWYNIRDIQDYDGSGMIYVTQNAVVYHMNIAVAVGCAVGRVIFSISTQANCD